MIDATPPWADPTVHGINREPMHSPLGAFPGLAEARTADRSSSPFRITLNGAWKFHLAPSPGEVPEGFHGAGYDDSAWGTMAVPGNWQLADTFDKPIYTNIRYPFEPGFKPNPPHVPEANPTGCYRHRFIVPSGWEGREVYITFESVDSNLTLWVNGEEVGYSEDSRLPAEFNITPYLTEGVNTLAVRVMRYCDGFYLEDQDYWHLSGIQRDVVLYSKPKACLRDYMVRTTFGPDFGDAVLRVGGRVSDVPDMSSYRVRAWLYDAEGREVLPAPMEASISGSSPMYGQGTVNTKGWADMEAVVPAPRKWSAEDPYLYTLVLALVDPDGRETDFEGVRIGFRQVEIKDRQLMVNGKRLIVRGVDRHEHHPDKGRALDTEDMRAEIVAMKRLNFNAVRTSHYPNDVRWYDLCDELGIYLVDEANLETHGIGAETSRDPEWASAYLARAMRMVQRDRNHPSVIVWSLGNESYHGPNHAAMAAWLRAYDPTRPVQYESGFPDSTISDICVPMYPRLDWVRELLADPGEKRPVILCEYAYAKGNATGNFKEFWDHVEKYPSFQGGFIWDWADKALTRTLPDGRRVWAYGGEFGCGTDYAALGEDPTQVLNGIVAPDLTPHPGAWEVKKVQSPVAFSASAADLRANRVTVANRYQFSDLAHLVFRWEVTEEGVVVGSGAFGPMAAGPGSKAAVALPVTLSDLCADPCKEYWLNVECSLADETPWAPAGHVIGWEQFALPFGHRTPGVSAGTGMNGTAPSLQNEPGGYRVSGDGWSLYFDKAAGTVTSLAVDGRELIVEGPVEGFYRAPLDNDYILGNAGSYLSRWREAGIDRLRRTVDRVAGALADDGTVVITVDTSLRGNEGYGTIRVGTDYRISGDGTVTMTKRCSVPPGMPVLPRVGIDMVLSPGLDSVEWYGRGPHENYPDRRESAGVGLYRSTVAGLYYPYIKPGECGGRGDVRWAALTDDGAGVGLRFTGIPTLQFSAMHYSVDDMEAVGHYHELVERPEVHLHLDHRHMGVGGDDGWTPNVHEEYLIKPGVFEWTMEMVIIGRNG